MIAGEALPSTGLVQPGSLLRHSTRVLLAERENSKALAAAARAAFPEAGWQIRDAADAAPGVERFVERLAMFLELCRADGAADRRPPRLVRCATTSTARRRRSPR